MHNSSPFKSYLIVRPCPVGCTADLVSDEELVPNETETLLPGRYPKPASGVAGTVVYILPEGPNDPSDHAELVTFQLRVVDISRSATAAGTELPVVRESAFRTTSTIQLLNVPNDPRFRIALRIFEMNLDHANFGVRVYDQSTNALLSARRVETDVAPQGPLRFTPAFLELDDLAPSQPATLRIEIAPLNSGVAFWAYVSITNNDSQQITLVTPQ
jgi:hypothetical protein